MYVFHDPFLCRENSHNSDNHADKDMDMNIPAIVANRENHSFCAAFDGMYAPSPGVSSSGISSSNIMVSRCGEMIVDAINLVRISPFIPLPYFISPPPDNPAPGAKACEKPKRSIQTGLTRSCRAFGAFWRHIPFWLWDLIARKNVHHECPPERRFEIVRRLDWDPFRLLLLLVMTAD